MGQTASIVGTGPSASAGLPARHGRELLSVGTLVVLVHAALLGGALPWLGSWGRFDVQASPATLPAVTVRRIVEANGGVGQAAGAAGPAAAAVAPLPRVAAEGGVRPPRPQRAQAAPQPGQAAAMVAAPQELPREANTAGTAPAPGASGEPPGPEAAASSTLPLDLPVPAAQGPAPQAAEGEAPPRFASRPAPPFRLHFDLRRGALSGSAELRWERSAERYELELRGQVLGVEAIGLLSRGGFDAHGLAPERFVDRRRGRERRAANFDPAAGRVTFSGPQWTHALLPGTQDRLSWMLQLPAIIDADPGRFGAGARLPVFVVGARGDADAWVFVVHGRETVQGVESVGTAPVEALRLTREPRKPYDTHVEIWLDPRGITCRCVPA